MIINHTECGMQTFKDDELTAKLHSLTDVIPDVPQPLWSFDDLEANTVDEICKVKTHPWVSKDIPVRGFIYDVKTVRLREVAPDN
jgi:carbonic anhydrase